MIFNNPIFQLPVGIAAVDMTFSTVRAPVISLSYTQKNLSQQFGYILLIYQKRNPNFLKMMCWLSKSKTVLKYLQVYSN